MIKTYEHGDKEYIALEIAAKMLTMLSPNGTDYEVEDVYFDFGANIMWTTVVAYGDTGNWQALTPRDVELITTCEIENITKAVNNTINSEYNPDRKKEN